MLEQTSSMDKYTFITFLWVLKGLCHRWPT